MTFNWPSLGNVSRSYRFWQIMTNQAPDFVREDFWYDCGIRSIVYLVLSFVHWISTSIHNNAWVTWQLSWWRICVVYYFTPMWLLQEVVIWWNIIASHIDRLSAQKGNYLCRDISNYFLIRILLDSVLHTKPKRPKRRVGTNMKNLCGILFYINVIVARSGDLMKYYCLSYWQAFSPERQLSLQRHF